MSGFVSERLGQGIFRVAKVLFACLLAALIVWFVGEMGKVSHGRIVPQASALVFGEALSSGELDVDSLADSALSGVAEPMPDGFEDEVVSLDGFGGAFACSEGRVVSCLFAGDPGEALGVMTERLLGQGWECVGQGEGTCASFVRGEGGAQTLFAQCFAGSKGSVVVLEVAR